MARLRADGVTLLPLYTTEEGGTVSTSTATRGPAAAASSG